MPDDDRRTADGRQTVSGRLSIRLAARGVGLLLVDSQVDRAAASTCSVALDGC
jgi:hypothetical protein